MSNQSVDESDDEFTQSDVESDDEATLFGDEDTQSDGEATQSDGEATQIGEDLMRVYRIWLENNNWEGNRIRFLSLLKNGKVSELFEIVSTCPCCVRHQQNRPETLGVLQHDGHHYHDGGCQCSCRSLARDLCQAWKIKMQPDQPDQPDQPGQPGQADVPEFVE